MSELYYAWTPVPSVSLRPNLQYIVHPGGTTRNSNAFVIALKAILAFQGQRGPLRWHRWSFLVAELTRRHLGFSEVFTVVSVAELVSMVALLVQLTADRNKPAAANPMPRAGQSAPTPLPVNPASMTGHGGAGMVLPLPGLAGSGPQPVQMGQGSDADQG